MQPIPSMLDIVNVSEVREDKNGRSYVNVTVKGDEKQYITLPNGTVIEAHVPARQSAVNAYENNYLDQQDFAWGKPVGTKVLGAIVTKTVAPYEIKGSDDVVRTVTTYSCPVFGNTNNQEEFEVATARAFASGGHPLNSSATTPVVEETMKG